MITIEGRPTAAADRRFTQRAMNVPLLTREREVELARLWRDDHDQAAIGELVSAYIRFSVSVANSFRGYGLPFGDLVQEGCVGLMQAAARFDPERGLRFSTYARWWVRAAIQEYVLQNWSIVRIGTTASQKMLFFKLRALKSKIEGLPSRHSDEAIQAEIATKLNVSESAVEAMSVRLGVPDKSLNEPVGVRGDIEAQDNLVDETASPEDIALGCLEGETRSRWIRDAMQHLTKREHMIIRERRLGDEKLTLATIGRRLGISKERVRQIEAEALAKLRLAIERNVGNPFGLEIQSSA